MKGIFKILVIVAVCMPLFAYDFSACVQKSERSMERVGNTYGIALKVKQYAKPVLFVYAPKSVPKGYKILKHDAFIGLYLLEPKSFLEPVEILTIHQEMLEDEIASVNPKDSISGKLASRMQSPIDYAMLNTPTFQNSLISIVCDKVYGIGIGGYSFIEKEYLERFLNSDSVDYGDIGVRVIQGDFGVEVSLVDPFFKANPFKLGDVITYINGEAIPNLASFRRVVWDLALNLNVPVRILRNGVEMEVSAFVDKLRGGELLGTLLKEDFFSRVHLSIDEDFTITYVGANANNGFENLRVGDRVLRVNQREVVAGYGEILKLLGTYPDMRQRWLVMRDNFQFFIDVNSNQAAIPTDTLTDGLLNEDARFSF